MMFYPHAFVPIGGLVKCVVAKRQAARRPLPDADRQLFKAGQSAFWLDPRRWDGIRNTHRDMFWMRRRPDVIDVRSA